MPAVARGSSRSCKTLIALIIFFVIARAGAGSGADAHAATSASSAEGEQVGVGPCSFAFASAGVQYDLSSLAGAVQTVVGGDGFNYTFVLCAYLPAPASPCMGRAASSAGVASSTGE